MRIEVDWQGEKRFRVQTQGGIELTVDGDAEIGATPMESALIALAACMGIDMVDILSKGRQDLNACTMAVSADRRDDPPRRFTAIRLDTTLTGRGIDPHKADRAVELSRSTYCSVWNSMAPDIDLETSVQIVESDGPS
jgi:putative redox protein